MHKHLWCMAFHVAISAGCDFTPPLLPSPSAGWQWVAAAASEAAQWRRASGRSRHTWMRARLLLQRAPEHGWALESGTKQNTHLCTLKHVPTLRLWQRARPSSRGVSHKHKSDLAFLEPVPVTHNTCDPSSVWRRALGKRTVMNWQVLAPKSSETQSWNCVWNYSLRILWKNRKQKRTNSPFVVTISSLFCIICGLEGQQRKYHSFVFIV